MITYKVTTYVPGENQALLEYSPAHSEVGASISHVKCLFLSTDYDGNFKGGIPLAILSSVLCLPIFSIRHSHQKNSEVIEYENNCTCRVYSS